VLSVGAEILPLDRGSKRRVFKLVRSLNRAGVATDLLVPDGPQRARLAAIAPAVHGYRAGHVALPPRPRLRRWAEARLRSWRRVSGVPPELFSEKLVLRAPPEAGARLAALLASGRYDVVLLHCAWLAPLRDAVPARLRDRVTWVCDSQDVHFVRERTAAALGRRLGVDLAREAALEREALRRFDAVIAISDADARALRGVVDADRTLLAPAAFDYARAPVRPPPAGRLRFGFLGGPMDANFAALARLLRDWWPEIRRRRPEAELVIAGPIGVRTDLPGLVAGRRGVRVAGFVPDLARYYASIDVALCPVVVQGGLNFKSVEALAAGKLLVTTPMGCRCLGADVPAIVCDDGAEIARRIDAAVARFGAANDPRRRGQAWALERFGEGSSYRTLVRWLDERLGPRERAAAGRERSDAGAPGRESTKGR
jgi:glycosyltransferase involved in cell wall biosynthesis